VTHTEAERLLGILIGGTSGWTNAADESLTIYLNQLCRLADAQSAYTAIDRIIQTWGEARRPPVALILSEYQTVMRRPALDRVALIPSLRALPSFTAGRQIAARNYHDEATTRTPDDIHVMSGWRKQAPSPRILDALLGIIGVNP